jgi:hypothetical protein
VVVLNVSLAPLTNAVARLAFYDMDGRETGKRQQGRVSVAANAKAECFAAELPACEGPVLARLTLTEDSGAQLDQNDYWLPGKDQFLSFAAAKKPALAVAVTPDGKRGARVRVTQTGSGVAGAVRLHLADAKTGKRILPAIFSDGWFNLLPGESRDIILDGVLDGVALDSCRVGATGEW